jgi:hypothetical protein
LEEAGGGADDDESAPTTIASSPPDLAHVLMPAEARPVKAKADDNDDDEEEGNKALAMALLRRTPVMPLALFFRLLNLGRFSSGVVKKRKARKAGQEGTFSRSFLSSLLYLVSSSSDLVHISFTHTMYVGLVAGVCLVSLATGSHQRNPLLVVSWPQHDDDRIPISSVSNINHTV